MDGNNKSLADIMAESGINIDPEAMKKIIEASESMVEAMNNFAQTLNEGIAELIKTQPLLFAKILPAGIYLNPALVEQIEQAKEAERNRVKRAMKDTQNINIYDNSLSEYKIEVEKFDWDKRKKGKEGKLPKKLRNGW